MNAKSTSTITPSLTPAHRQFLTRLQKQSGLVAVLGDGTVFEATIASAGVPNPYWQRNEDAARHIQNTFTPAESKEQSAARGMLAYVHILKEHEAKTLIAEIPSLPVRRRLEKLMADCVWNMDGRGLLVWLKKITQGMLSAAKQKLLCNSLWVYRDCVIYANVPFELYDVNKPLPMGA